MLRLQECLQGSMFFGFWCSSTGDAGSLGYMLTGRSLLSIKFPFRLRWCGRYGLSFKLKVGSLALCPVASSRGR